MAAFSGKEGQNQGITPTGIGVPVILIPVHFYTDVQNCQYARSFFKKKLSYSLEDHNLTHFLHALLKVTTRPKNKMDRSVIKFKGAP